jgi:amidohydrolase
MIVDSSITEIRHHIHQNPELSGEEVQTAKFVKKFFEHLSGYKISQKAGMQSLVISKKFGEGKTVAFRAELDALPVNEISSIKYKSQTEGVSHACGHDGHLTTLLHLARIIEKDQPTKGTVVYLLQSAEETGQGAAKMVESDVVKNAGIDVVYALHNIPGKEMGTAFLMDGIFSCASVGVRVKLKGKTAHAAHPDEAINPLIIANDLLRKIDQLPESPKVKGFALTTPLAMSSGLEAFGTTPEKAEFSLVMRTETTPKLKVLIDEVEKLIENTRKDTKAEISVGFEEYFPAVRNSDFSHKVKAACKASQNECAPLEKPFRWSEDFSHFEDLFPVFMFGLGSGNNTAPLHAPTYDFPDQLIKTGAAIFYELFKMETQET